MKLERNAIKKVAKILSNIPYNPVKETHYIAIPIETEKVREFDGIELTMVNKEQGVKRPPEPVLLVHSGEKNPVILGYADISYARRFDILDYCELLNVKILKNESEILDNLDILLVHKDNVLMGFEF